MDKKPTFVEVMRYGKILTDDIYAVTNTLGHDIHIRIRNFDYKDKIYYIKMADGEIMDFKELKSKKRGVN